MTPSRSPAKKVFDDLIDGVGIASFYGGCDNASYIARQLHRGQPIPDRLKPGYVIQKLSEEKREALKGLTSEDVQDRIPMLLPA